MSLKVLVPVVALLALAGCTSTGGGGMAAGSGAAASANMEERAAFVGTWSGRLPSGKPVSVRIPESGTPTYRFMNGNVPVRSVRMSGGSMVLSVGNGPGTVRLTPEGNQLGYAYRSRGDAADTTLTRS